MNRELVRSHETLVSLFFSFFFSYRKAVAAERLQSRTVLSDGSNEKRDL